jgi:hypothetical protein
VIPFLKELEMGEVSYEAPAVIELGSVAEMTLGDCFDTNDGMLGGPTPRVSGLCLP